MASSPDRAATPASRRSGAGARRGAWRPFVLETVAQPDGIGAGVESASGRWRSLPPLDRSARAWDGRRAAACAPRRDASRPRRVGRRIERGRRGADQDDRAIGAFGALDQALGMGGARGPAGRARPAVVDDQHQRPAAGSSACGFRSGWATARISQPRPAAGAAGSATTASWHRRLLGRLQVEQQPDRREGARASAAGGITRSSHHSTGRARQPGQHAQGAAKARAPRD
jgi:hypothetical protein